MRTMHCSSCGLARLRGLLRVALAALWLGCAVLLAQVGGGRQAFGANTDPAVIAAVDQQIDEGQLIDLSGRDGAAAVGFLLDPDSGDTHTATVNWGDGTGGLMANVIGSGPAKPIGATHTYADGGGFFSDHSVMLTVSDGVGTPATDTFLVRVFNVNPTLGVTPSSTSINEGQSVSMNAAFSDPGFDNPLNATTESFRYYLNWGDGLGTIATQDVADINGGPGVPSVGMFGGIHTYANDGVYTVTVRLADDDMTADFVNGTAGVDYVEQVFSVEVSAIPEPGAIVLTMIGLACLVAQRRRAMHN